jgi:hypothetical protein
MEKIKTTTTAFNIKRKDFRALLAPQTRIGLLKFT